MWRRGGDPSRDGERKRTLVLANPARGGPTASSVFLSSATNLLACLPASPGPRQHTCPRATSTRSSLTAALWSRIIKLPLRTSSMISSESTSSADSPETLGGPLELMWRSDHETTRSQFRPPGPGSSRSPTRRLRRPMASSIQP